MSSPRAGGPAPRIGEQSLHGRPARFARGFTTLAPGVHAWLQPNGDWSESNAGLVVGHGSALLIDTAWDLQLTRQLLAAAGSRTAGAPIDTLVLTHGDGDHANGAQLLPDAAMICSDAAAADLTHERPAGLRRSAAGARLLARVAAGRPRAFGRYIAGMFAPFDLDEVTIRSPDRTFAERLDLDVGGQLVELRRLGPAHTAGDTIAHLPASRVVFAGDLLFSGVTPNSWSGSVTSWRRALSAILELEPAVVVPGHGPPGDAQAVVELDAYWGWLDTQARAYLANGLTVDETALRILRSDAFLAQPWGRWDCPERTVLNVVTVDRARRGVPTQITHRERPRLMWKVAMLARRLQSAAEGEDAAAPN